MTLTGDIMPNLSLLHRVRNRGWLRTVCLAILFPVLPLQAAVITNVSTVNVTPTSFSIVWKTAPSSPSIQVYADSKGVTNLSAELSAQAFPLHTGNPDAPDSYSRRLSRTALRDKTRASNLSMIKISGCKPATTYYYRLTSSPAVGTAVTYPVTGDLPSVTTETQNTFVIDDQQLLIDIPGLDTSGQIALLTHPAAKHPLAAVVGDGAGTNQVVFNLNNLFAAAGSGNFAPIGQQVFDLAVMSANLTDTRAQFTVSFGPNFVVAGTTYVGLGNEFVACTVGSSIIRVGERSTVPLDYNSSGPVSRLDLTLKIPPGRLQDFTLESLAPEIDPLTSTAAVQDQTNLLITLRARTGQVMLGQKTLGKFGLRAALAQDSAFVPLILNRIVAAKQDASLVTSVFGSSGRLVIVGTSPLLEAGPQTPGNRPLTLYAKPFSTVALEYSTSIDKPNWTRLEPVPVTNLVTRIIAWNKPQSQLFYRAVEFFADPPLLQAAVRQDGSRWLTLFGKPGHAYSILAGDLLTSREAWPEVLQTTLVNSFAFVPAPGNETIFYDVKELPPVGGPRLEITQTPDGVSQFTLSGRAGTSCLIETAPLSSPTTWSPVLRVPMTTPSVTLPQLPGNPAGALYRASEFTANPPLLEPVRLPGPERRLLLYGEPAASYSLEYATNISNSIWSPSSTRTLDASFTYISATETNGTIFFRVKKH